MALHFLLRVNGEAIGLVNIRRLHDLVPGQPSEYEVHAEYPAGQKHEARVMHDYDDGALVLTRKAVAALVNATDPIAEAEARGYQRAIDALRDTDRFLKFSETHPLVEHVNPFGANDMAADYLEASAHTAIRSGESTDE